MWGKEDVCMDKVFNSEQVKVRVIHPYVNVIYEELLEDRVITVFFF